VREQEATEPGGDVPALIVVHGDARLEVAQDTGCDLWMVEVEELEAVSSQGDSGPETWW
jgi:hypothetical protein